MRIVACLTAVLALGLAACSEESPSAPTPASISAPAAASAAVMSDGYPVDYCIVSGEKLGEMGSPDVVTVEGRTVKLCCPSCVSKLRKDPAKYLAVLDAAAVVRDAAKPTHDVAKPHVH